MKFSRYLLLSLLFNSLSLFAASSERNIQIGIYTSNITYKEPSVMKENGSLFGFTGRIVVRKTSSFLALEGAYSSGDMDYDGSGAIKGIPDEMLEIRGVVGRDLRLNSEYKITPYIGLGYRNLNDDSSGMRSSTNASGYEREQVYLYSPIGVEFQRNKMLGGWILRGRVEYDYFIQGKNHSYTGALNGYDDVSFDQHDGYGWRLSVGLTRMLTAGRSITIEPFYKYWNISESDVTYDSDGDGWIEPDNNSKELGISLSLTF